MTGVLAGDKNTPVQCMYTAHKHRLQVMRSSIESNAKF